jgi:hypothetical protein
MDKMVIGFTSDLREEILRIFGKEINTQGIIVESDTKKEVYSPDGYPIESKTFAGITKGSEIYIKSDIVSLIDLADRLCEKNELA